jgi:bifunctional non-homologous end joining protein LigD
MPLEEYKKKRKFNKTPEPTGGDPADNKLHFVVQKHAASHLHYDFRLELRGVLKSWAVPKGPSLNPDEKRLAMLTEDHPYDYLLFEGTIPKGQYGGGTVIVWDEGTYDTPDIDSNDKKAQEHSITSQFWKGGILFNLHGKKLKGQFALIKDPEKDDKSWYLIKVKDKYATKQDIAKKDKSVLSNLTVEQMAANPQAKEWQSNRDSKEVTEEPPSYANHVDVELIKKGDKSPMPQNIKPMLCTRIYEPFNSEAWVYELKLDGYRIVAHVNKGEVILRTRELQDYTYRYPPIVPVLQSLGHDVILDGEVVALDKNQKPDFSLIQNYKGQSPLIYYVFDLLWIDGYDITKLPLLERKKILCQIIPENNTVVYHGHIEEQGVEFFELVKQKEMEGLVAKQKESSYYANTRSKSWLKLPVEEFKDYVIVGFTESEHGRPFSRLMFAEYRDGKLYYVGHSGGGISDKLLYSTYNVLKKLEVKDKPVVNDAIEETPIHWLKPVKVGRFKEKALAETKSGKKRHPVIFIEFRDDIGPRDVGTGAQIADQEAEVGQDEMNPSQKKAKRKSKKTFNEIEIWKQIHPDEEITDTDVLEVEGKSITLINYNKEYWPKGITKLHVIMYYRTMAEYIISFLKDRPLGLNVVMDWPGGETKFIRNMKDLYPEWVTVYSTDRRVEKKGKSEEIDWVLCNDLATLLYMVNLGAVDFHPWAARTELADYPDYIIIDLDPDKEAKVYLPELIKTAQATKKILDKYKLASFIKTSGKRGMHILIPCERISYAETTTIAEFIANAINQEVPAITTLERDTKRREAKIYIDAYQNNYSDRLASAYSLRAYKQPTVSTPLNWDEVNNKLNPKQFKFDNVQQRIEEKGDLFANLLNSEILSNNTKILRELL